MIPKWRLEQETSEAAVVMQGAYLLRVHNEDSDPILYKGADLMNSNRKRKTIIWYFLFLSLLIRDVHAGDMVKDIAIGFLPCSKIYNSFMKYSPLIAYLQRETGMKISLKVPADFEEFERGIKNGDIAFALQDPNIYVKLLRSFNKKYLVGTLTRNGQTRQSGVVIVRRDSGITNLMDLKGKSVMFGSRLSAYKWLAAKSMFKESGIDLDQHLKAYSNGDCCEEIAFSVYLKAVDAGVVCDHFLGEHLKKQRELGINAEEINILARTRPVPTKVFAFRKGLHQDIITDIVRALLKLDKRNPAHKTILDRAEVGGFFMSRAETYNIMRPLAEEKRTE